MPNWDDRRGRQEGPRQDAPGPDYGRERWRREGRDRQDSERRSFGDDNRYAPDQGRSEQGRGEEDWRRNRYAARYDQDRTGYGREREDTRRYGGQDDRPEGQSEYSGGFPSGGGGEFDPDYLRWRDEQLRSHDRDYDEWRRHQHAQYDEQYRQFRTERREHFGRTFHQWRSQQSLVGGIPDTSVAPGAGGYGDKTGIPGGYNVSFGGARPSGQLDPPGHLSADPAMSQTGGSGGGASQGSSSGAAQAGANAAPEFGKEPPQVQASADGDVRRDTERKDDDRSRDDKTPRH